MKQWVPIEVQSYAGYRGDETPRRFFLGQTEHLVDRVLWRTDELTTDGRRLRRFHVQTQEGENVRLIQEVETSRWYLEQDD